MDRDRYRQRAHDLRGCAQLVQDLTRMPDRATEKDFRQVADLMTGAASALDELLKATPPGCICRRIQDDNYSYLDYVEGCFYHRELHLIREECRANYAKMEKALKNEARMKLVAAALSGTATLRDLRDPTAGADDVVERAIQIADEVLRRVTEVA